jgi:hypothetical protein
MRAAVIAAAMIALLPGIAFAQSAKTQRTEEQKKNDAEIDQQYRQAIKDTGGVPPAAAGKSDPWGTLRPAPAAEAAPKKLNKKDGTAAR